MAPPIKPSKAYLPALHRRLVVDTVNGKVRVRAWPKPRGKNVPEQVRIQNERFAQAQRLAKTAKAEVMNRFIKATKGTGLYPRDLFTRMMLAPPISFDREDGFTVTYARPILMNKLFQGFVLQLGANQPFPASTIKPLDWPLPILDTGGFFSPSAVDRITIPQGVIVMQFWCGVRRTTSSNTTQQVGLLLRSSPDVILRAQSTVNSQNIAVASGPIVVQPGEQYSAYVFDNAAGAAAPDRTFFAGEVLHAQ